MNDQGIRFGEWLRAANWGRKVPIRMDLARRAWQLGEDPCQYACETKDSK